MTPRPPEHLQAEFDRLARVLADDVPPNDRAALKAAIVTLFRETDTALDDLAALKERIRELIAAFKALPPQPPPVTMRHDHLGASTHIERGWSALAGGDWESAQRELEQAVNLDSTSATARALLGWALMYQDQLDEALQLCLQVLLHDPEHGLARVAVGTVCLRKGIVGEAIEHLSRVVERSADGRAVLYANFWLGLAYLERDMDGDAVEFLHRAVTQGPNLAEGWAELGRARWRRGQRDQAREAWRTGAAIRHSPHARRCAAMLDEVARGGSPLRSPFT